MAVTKRACDACHSRKIQCETADGESACDWCAHHHIGCTFNRVRGRKKRISKVKPDQPNRDIADRIGRIEDALAQATRSKTGSNTPREFVPANTQVPSSLGEQLSQFRLQNSPLLRPTSTTPAACPDDTHFAGYVLSRLRSPDDVPLFSEAGQAWIHARTGENSLFREIAAAGAKNQLPQSPSDPAQAALSGRDLPLPEESLVQECFRIFLDSSFRLAFPVVDELLFKDIIAVAYGHNDASLECTSAKACIFAFLANASLFQGGPTSSPAIDSDDYALGAQFLLFDVLQDASLTSLQTLFMLSIHEMFSGRPKPATKFHAMASRIAFSLGGHLASNCKVLPRGSQLSIRQHHHLRVLFWLCYAIDKEIALRSGQPPFIADDACDLTLPSGYVAYQTTLDIAQERHRQLDHNDMPMPVVPGDLRLSIIKAKTCRLLYSDEALKKTDAELLCSIRELDAEIEAWRLSVSPVFRPCLSIAKSPRLITSSELHDNMCMIITHLEYHYLLATIHLASGRCQALPSEGGVNISVSSSLELSVEASRSTLFYLRAAAHVLADEVFWVVVFYPISAVTTLFCNILVRPLDPQGREDLELLESTIDVIHKMPIRRLATHEIAHMRLLDEFIGELVRLGTSAVNKAERERELLNRSEV